ncbi:MAG: glycosyltransferase family 39 protein [Bacteroidia bacterium]
MKKWYSIALIVLSLIIGHFNHFSLSPRGVHVWRQCNTLAVAQNFHEEDLDFRYPRVDHRKESSGVTGMSFPLTEQLIAFSYKIFGVHHINHRLVQFFIFIIGLIGMHLLLIRLFSSRLVAGIACFFYAWTPEMYYHSINAIPDVAAMSAIIFAFYFYFGKRPLDLVWCLILLALAGLVKFQYLLFGPVFFVHTLAQKQFNKSIGIAYLGLFAGGVVSLWYIHAAKMRNMNHLYDFGLFVNSTGSKGEALRLLKANLVMDLPEQLLGYGAFILALVGAFVYIKEFNKVKIWTILTIIVCFGFYHVKELKQMEYHAYYMMPYILLGILLVAYLLKKIEGKKYIWWLLVPLALLQIVHAVNKINSRYLDSNSNLPEEFLSQDQLTEMQQFVQGGKLAVVGPDQSGCIYFYYLGVKGWNAASINQLKDKEEIASAIMNGKADVLIINKMNKVDKSYYSKLYGQELEVGNFSLFKERLLH